MDEKSEITNQNITNYLHHDKCSIFSSFVLLQRNLRRCDESMCDIFFSFDFRSVCTRGKLDDEDDIY